MSVDMNINTDVPMRGICTFKGFLKRLNIFISRSIDTDLLEGIDFNKLNIAITGSVMTACCQENHPLLSIFKNTGSMSDLYNLYFVGFG
jgi:hypothetical protein